jgi:mannose-6-phosphate isomerase-like protein (cupin superfamily)
MSLIKEIEIYPLAKVKGQKTDFFTPQASDETMLVQIRPMAADDLIVHKFQTNQLLVVRGSMVLVVLQNRRYEYIALSQHQPTVVKIPPGVPHGVINLTKEPCVMVNAVLRHSPNHEPNHRSVKPPFPYDFITAKALLRSIETPQLIPIPA